MVTNNLVILPAYVGRADNTPSCLNSDDSTKSSTSRESGIPFHRWGLPVGVISSDPALFLRAIMRVVAHGIAYFKDTQSIKSLKGLMVNWGSCRRSAYQAIHKHGLHGNDIKGYCKKNGFSSTVNDTLAGGDGNCSVPKSGSSETATVSFLFIVTTNCFDAGL